MTTDRVCHLKAGSSLLALVLLLIGICMPVSADASRIQNARNGVVCIVTQNQAGTATVWGTGFSFLRTGTSVHYVATNNHVIEGALANRSDIKVYYSRQSDGYVTAAVVAQSSEKDLAVLKLSAPVADLEPLALLPAANVQDAETVYALGFPGDAFKGSNAISFNRTDITVTSGVISNRIIQMGTKCFQTDVHLSAGDSGGPLLNASGDVVGINTRTLKDNGSMNYAVTSDELIDLLIQHGLSYRQAGTGDRLTWLLGGAGAMILLALAVSLASRLTRRRKAAAVGGVVAGALDGTAGGAMGGPVPGRAAVARLPAAAVAERSAMIYGLTGVHANGRIGLRTGQLVFGRDASACQVVFPPDRVEIAARHCVIAYDAAQMGFAITDLGTETGTFIGNGLRLQPNQKVQLKDGDTFYLGDRSQLFRLRIE